MFIGVTSYGGTGASACVDILKEFENTQFYETALEFQLMQYPDGILDLYYNLVENPRRTGVNTALRRFLRRCERMEDERIRQVVGARYQELSHAYAESLIQLHWQGRSCFDPPDIRNRWERYDYRHLRRWIRRFLALIHSSAEFPSFSDRYFTAITEEEFTEKTKAYLNAIFEASGFDLQKPIILEQFFPLARPEKGAQFLDGDYRSIIIDRDPRDYFTLLTCFYWSKRSMAFMPTDGDVRSFAAYYKGLHVPPSQSEKVFYLQFEDLIYNYEETAARLAAFTGLRHTEPFTHFRPDWSINNTRLWAKHPEIAEDISYIERELSEYLYPFEKYENSLPFQPKEMGVFDSTPGDMG